MKEIVNKIAKTKNKNEAVNQEMRFKNRIIFVLLVIVLFAMYKFATYPKQLTVFTPPDISQSFVQKIGDVPNSSVYGFARTLWEALNYCENNCLSEYPQRLDQYKAFLTKACYTELSDHFRFNQSLYDSRSRRLLPTENTVFDLERVKKISSDTWYVSLQYLLDDDIGGTTTRRQIMEYPLKITSSGVPTQYNPWGMSIDCYWQDPVVIEYQELPEVK